MKNCCSPFVLFLITLQRLFDSRFLLQPHLAWWTEEEEAVQQEAEVAWGFRPQIVAVEGAPGPDGALDLADVGPDEALDQAFPWHVPQDVPGEHDPPDPEAEGIILHDFPAELIDMIFVEEELFIEELLAVHSDEEDE